MPTPDEMDQITWCFRCGKWAAEEGKTLCVTCGKLERQKREDMEREWDRLVERE